MSSDKKVKETPLYFLRDKIESNNARETDHFLDSLLKVRSENETKQVYSQWAENYEKVSSFFIHNK